VQCRPFFWGKHVVVSVTPSCCRVVAMEMLHACPISCMLALRLPIRITGSNGCLRYSASRKSSSVLGSVFGDRYVPSSSQRLWPVTMVALIELGERAHVPSKVQWWVPARHISATPPCEGLTAEVVKTWNPWPCCAYFPQVSLVSVRSAMSVFRSAMAWSASRRWVLRADTTLKVVMVMWVAHGTVGLVGGLAVATASTVVSCVGEGGRAGWAGCGGSLVGVHAGKGTGGRGRSDSGGSTCGGG